MSVPFHWLAAVQHNCPGSLSTSHCSHCSASHPSCCSRSSLAVSCLRDCTSWRDSFSHLSAYQAPISSRHPDRRVRSLRSPDPRRNSDGTHLKCLLHKHLSPEWTGDRLDGAGSLQSRGLMGGEPVALHSVSRGGGGGGLIVSVPVGFHPVVWDRLFHANDWVPWQSCLPSVRDRDSPIEGIFSFLWVFCGLQMFLIVTLFGP